MPATDLATSSRAQQLSALAALNASNPAYLSSLITTASDSIRRYCARDFWLTNYSQYYTIGVQQKQQPLLIRQYPVTEITRVALANQCLFVQNSNVTGNQRATVETTATGIKLVTIASAVATTTNLAYSTYPTINAIAAAINAVGNGWNTAVWSGNNGSYGLWPSADLKPLQGAVSAFQGGAYLEIYEDCNTGSFGIFTSDNDWAGWWNTPGPGWRLDPETGEFYFRSMRGSLVLRIDYTAGYPMPPEPVQEACVQLAQWLYQMSQANFVVKSVKLGNTSIENAFGTDWPSSVKMLLSPYKDHSRMIYR